MKRRALTITVVLMILGSALASSASGAGSPAPSLIAPGHLIGNFGQFTTQCRFSHRGPDDPIVSPGKPGASHSHDFFGNVSTNAGSTHQSLLAADTTCRRPGDTAAYWVPTLSLNGTAVTPRAITAYYLARGKRAGTIEAFPAGLRVIAGDAKATSAQSLAIVGWRCAGVLRSDSAMDPTCPFWSHLVLRIRFPDCWNGRDLDSADHKGHLAYSRFGRCPATHPVALPGIGLHVHYPIQGGSGVSLASGGVYSGHADFFNAWDQARLEALVDRCLNAGIICARL